MVFFSELCLKLRIGNQMMNIYLRISTFRFHCHTLYSYIRRPCSACERTALQRPFLQGSVNLLINYSFLPSACGRPKGIVVIQASVRLSVTHYYTVNFLTQRFRDIILGQKVAQGLYLNPSSRRHAPLIFDSVRAQNIPKWAALAR